MKQNYTINIEYGSEFQKQVYSEMINACLTVLKSQCESAHKKNVFDFYLNDNFVCAKKLFKQLKKAKKYMSIKEKNRLSKQFEILKP